MLLIDPEAALAALPSMLPADRQKRLDALELLKQVLSASGAIAGDGAERLRRIDRLFRADHDTVAPAEPASLPAGRNVERRKAS